MPTRRTRTRRVADLFSFPPAPANFAARTPIAFLTRSAAVHEVLSAFVTRVPALFFVVFVMFAAAVVVRVFHRFAAYLRGELKTKPKRVPPPSALAFVEIVLKYVIYLAALIIAILGGIRTLPQADRDFIQQNIGSLVNRRFQTHINIWWNGFRPAHLWKDRITGVVNLDHLGFPTS